jgi:hypothetical protein
VRVPDHQLGGILDHDEPLTRPGPGEQRTEQRRLPRPRITRMFTRI